LVFSKGKSERADILDLEVSNDGVSFAIVKSKIKNLAAAGLVGLLVDPLLSISTGVTEKWDLYLKWIEFLKVL
jgi:hypothetical protein